MITFSKLGHYGQLGNQMFEYALLLGVAAKHGYDVVLPHSPRGAGKKRGRIELYDAFSLNARFKPANALKLRLYQERFHGFDPQVFEQPDGTDYAGYFQSPRYFAHCTDVVSYEFRFTSDLRAWSTNWRRQRPDYTVAVHVRRGDYLDRPDVFHVLGADWYRAAMLKFDAEAKFVAFTDDKAWCERCLPGATICDAPTYLHELAAMTLCDGHIISASSFGWWGAWLAGPACRVVAPWPWFPPTSPFKNEDILPDTWVRQQA